MCVVGCWLPFIRGCVLLFDVCCLLFAVLGFCSMMCDVYGLFFVVCCLLFAVCCLMCVVRCLICVVCCPLGFVQCSLCVVCCFWFRVVCCLEFDMVFRGLLLAVAFVFVGCCSLCFGFCVSFNV